MGVEVFDAADPTRAPTRYEGVADPVTDIAYSPAGDLLAAVPSFAYAAETDNVTVWRVGEPDRPVARLTLPDRGVELRPTPDLGSPGFVAFSPDGSRLFVSGAGPVAVFDLATGAVIDELDGRGALALSPDGGTLAVRSEGAHVRLVDTETGATTVELPAYGATVTAASFSADGHLIATTSTDETVSLWDTSTGERLQVLEGHAGAVIDVAFAGTSSTLHSIAADRSIFEWDAEGGSRLTHTLVEGSIDGAAESLPTVSPTGDSIVAASAEGPQWIDAETGRVTALEGGMDREIAWGAYSPTADASSPSATRGTPGSGTSTAVRSLRPRLDEARRTTAPSQSPRRTR